MIREQYAQPGSHGARLFLILKGIGLALVALLLIPILLLTTNLPGNTSLLLPIVVIVGLIGAASVLRRPHWGVFALIAALVIDVDPIGIPFLSPPYVLSMLLLVPLVLKIMHEREIWVLRVPQIQIILVIALLFLSSIAWNSFVRPVPITLTSHSADKIGTTRQLIIFTSRLALLIFFLYFITTRERIEQVIWLIVGLVVFIAMEALFPFLFHGMVKRAHADFSLAENANRLAYICLFATCILWFHLPHQRNQKWRYVTIPLLFLLPLTTLTTGSRSGFLQSVLLGAFILREQKGWSIAHRIRSLVFLAGAALLVLTFTPTKTLQRLVSFNPDQAEPGQDSLRNRIHTDIAAIQIGADHPIFGVGLSNFVWMKAFYGLSRGAPTHNSYLWALTSGGIGAVALYLLLFYVTYTMIRRLERAGPSEWLWLSKALRINVILFLFFSAFADMWLSDFMYLLLGLITSMYYLWQRQRQHLSHIRFAPKRQRHRVSLDLPTPVAATRL